MYDILKTPIPESGRSTDKQTLSALKTPFTEAILEYRHYSKLLSGFTIPLPNWLSKRDGKLHASFNQMGKEENNVRTGRFSSTDPNLQQIPSREKVMRMVFKASTEFHSISAEDFTIVVDQCSDVETPNGWRRVKDLSIGDKIVVNDTNLGKLHCSITNISTSANKYIITYCDK